MDSQELTNSTPLRELEVGEGARRVAINIFVGVDEASLLTEKSKPWQGKERSKKKKGGGEMENRTMLQGHSLRCGLQR